MRVALVTENFLPKIDGVTRTLAMLLEHLQRQRHQAIVLAPEGAPKRYAGAQVFGTPGVPLPMYPELRILLPSPKLKQLLGRFRPDVIHVADPMVLGAAAIFWAQSLNIPVVSTYHTNLAAYCNYFHLGMLTEPTWAYRRFLHSHCQVTLCPSPSTALQLEQKGFSNVAVWPRGVNGALFTPSRRSAEWRHGITANPAAKIILYVGRLSYEKNLEALLTAFKTIESDEPDAHLVLVGDGPARQELEQALEGRRATFTGFLKGEALAEAYASADLFAFPSTTETFGQAVLEAMASGLPVVAFNAEGVRDLVRHEETGLLVPEGDTAAFTEGVRSLLTHPEQQAAMHERARSAAEARTWDSVLNDLMQTYENAIARSHRKSAA
ncbi:MAG TPA: glycosyltransferase family 1 protein [Ktedonobacterales bacterium]|nr:glycosyltransferase family 1 protein [Ktedonobacterales bacterium]